MSREKEMEQALREVHVILAQQPREPQEQLLTNLLAGIDALLSKPAPAQPEQQPVAWRLSLPDGRMTLEAAYPSWADGDGYSIQPLYAAPIAQAAPQQSGLVEAARAALGAIQAAMEDAYHNAYPECCGSPRGHFSAKNPLHD